MRLKEFYAFYLFTYVLTRTQRARQLVNVPKNMTSNPARRSTTRTLVFCTTAFCFFVWHSARRESRARALLTTLRL